MKKIAPASRSWGGPKTLPRLFVCAAFVALAALGTCEFFYCELAEEREALRMVRMRGYTEPRTVDWSILDRHRIGCDDGDDIGFVIEARTKDGGRIRLNVCCGSSFRGCRFTDGMSNQYGGH